MNLAEAIRRSPEFFAREIVGFQPFGMQIDILNAFRDRPRVAVKTGHSFGKDSAAALAALWFHCAYRGSVVVTTAPTQRQVRNVMWAEIASLFRNAAKRGGTEWRIGGDLQTEALRTADPKHYMIGYTADDPGGFTGFHSAHAICVIVSEAQAIEPRMWPAINSLLTAPVSKLLIVGNAYYQPDSEFYAAFTSKRDTYACFTGSSEDSPYCSKEFIENEAAEWGRDSPMFRARVGGEFSPEVVESLIPLAWIDAAQKRWSDAEPTRPADAPEPIRTMGVDVAWSGTDSNVIYLGVGDRFKKIYEQQGQDPTDTCGAVRRLADEHKVKALHVRVDASGVGVGVIAPLHLAGFMTTPVTFGSCSSDQAKYKNLRAEMYWNLRERFRTNTIAIDPKDTKLAAELSVIQRKEDPKGLIQIEKKDDIRKRLGRSPDASDALALCAMKGAVMEEALSRRVLFQFSAPDQIRELQIIFASVNRIVGVHQDEQGRYSCVFAALPSDGAIHVYDEVSFVGLDQDAVIRRLCLRVLGERHRTGPTDNAVPSAPRDFRWIVNVSGKTPAVSHRVGPVARSTEIDVWSHSGLSAIGADGRIDMAADELVALCRKPMEYGAGFRVDPACTDTISSLLSLSRDASGLRCDGPASAVLYVVRFVSEFRRTLEPRSGGRRPRNYAYEE